MKHNKSEALYKEYSEYILPIIHFEKPIIEKASGTYVYDVDGNKILDLNGGQFCTIFGHSNEEMKKVFDEINSSIQHTNTSTLTTHVLKAMKTVSEIMPELNPASIFLATGSEAIEFAIRYAKHITKKNGLISFDIGYHGLTLGSQSITYGGVHAKPIVSEVFTMKTPKNIDDSDNIKEIFENFEIVCQSNEIAAVVIEPIVSVGGMYVQSRSFLVELRKLCDKYDIILIFDECQTGFGRTGEWFAYQKVGVVPDIVVTAKGFGMGYPVSMVAIAKKYVDGFLPLVHYSSHQNDPFSSQLISFGVDYIKDNDLLQRVTTMGDYFYKKLKNISETKDCFSVPRGAGLMLGCDLKIEGVVDYRKISAEFRDYLLVEHNLMIQATNGGQTLRFLPSYLISKEEIDEVIEILEKSSEMLSKYKNFAM